MPIYIGSKKIETNKNIYIGDKIVSPTIPVADFWVDTSSATGLVDGDTVTTSNIASKGSVPCEMTILPITKYKTGGLNGHPYFSVTRGVNDINAFLLLKNVTTNVKRRTAFVVAKHNWSMYSDCFFISQYTMTGTPTPVWRYDNRGIVAEWFNGTKNTPSSAWCSIGDSNNLVGNGENFIFATRFKQDKKEDVPEIWVNDRKAVYTTTFVTAEPYAGTTYTADLYIACAPSPNTSQYNQDVNFYEMIYYDRYLSDSEMESVKSYLKNKYAL